MNTIPPWERSGPLRLVGGVDLGAHGAWSLVDADAERLFYCQALPMVKRKIGKTMRSRIDYEAWHAVLQMLVGFDVELWTVENPGAGFGAGGRELGEHAGAFRAFAEVLRMQVAWVTAGVWKKALKVPADKLEACLRAEQLFPNERDMLKGGKQRRHDGKAESALVALYGIRHVLGKA